MSKEALRAGAALSSSSTPGWLVRSPLAAYTGYSSRVSEAWATGALPLVGGLDEPNITMTDRISASVKQYALHPMS